MASLVSKVGSDERIRDIIVRRSGLVSKSCISDEIFYETGVRLARITIYNEQRRLGLL